MRLVSGKKANRKCPKGWRKVSWNTEGPGVVRDRTGKVVGKLIGIFPAGGVVYMVQRNGAQYMYLGSGELFTLGGGSPNFKTIDCTGPAYLSSSGTPAQTARLLKVVGGPFRFVYRTTDDGFPVGPARAWKSAGAFEPVLNMQLYELNATGACVPDGALFTGNLINLVEVKAPPDFKGQLRLVWR